MTETTPTRQTPLHGLHQSLGAKLVPFAGWDMPLQYEGVIAEHLWCRSSAALFDVSHMAVIELWGADPATALEALTPAGITTLAEGRQRYGLLLNQTGGVVDDFMVTNWGQHLTMVVNASRRDADLAHLAANLDPTIEVRERPDLALIALQGPLAGEALASLGEEAATVAAETVFLDNRLATINTTDGPISCAVARSGYTGEDGFEIAVTTDSAVAVAQALLNHEAVKPAGLGARDTLRLEAGLCLYGNDLDETTSPVEADLVWSMPKRRREAGDFLGAERVQSELADGPERVRVGLRPNGKRPVRDGAVLSNTGQAATAKQGTGQAATAKQGTGQNATVNPVGVVSSGGFGPSVDGPVAMAYVHPDHSATGTSLDADVRGRTVTSTVADLPFSPHHYRRSV